MSKEVTYQEDVDNQTGIKQVRNYMIGPVYSHKTAVEGDVYPEWEYQRGKPIGILQLINKHGIAKISNYDIEKFKAVQNLIGLAIDKTSEIHSTVNIRIGVQKHLKEMHGLVKDQPITEDAYGITSGDIIDMNYTKKEVKKMIECLEDLKSQLNWIQ